MVYSLVHFCFIVQNHKGLRGRGVTIENKAQISTLTLHIIEVYEGSVEPKSRQRTED